MLGFGISAKTLPLETFPVIVVAEKAGNVLNTNTKAQCATAARVIFDIPSERERVEALRFRRIEQWRDRLLQEGAGAIERLAAEVPGIDVASVTDLVARARAEQPTGDSTGASRALFRLLREAFTK